MAAFLADDHRQADTAGGRHREATGLGDQVVGPDLARRVLHQPAGAVVAERLLVGDRDEDEVTFGPEALVGQMPHRDRHRCGEVEHVHRSATPDLAVDQLSPERVVSPFRRLRRHDVGVPNQGERGCAWSAALDPGDKERRPGKGS